MPMIAKDLSSGVCRTEFELDADEYCAIGRVTAQWAYLEHGVYAITEGIARHVGIDTPTDALSTSFKRRLTALRLLVLEYAVDDERQRMESIIGKIANAEQDRHKITHAMWDWDEKNPDRIKASSFRPGLEFEKRFDAKRMHNLADNIGQISFALEYPEGFDAAISDIMAERTDENGNVAYVNKSRLLHRALSSHKAQAQRESDQATPPKDTPPQPSSEK